jgi:hypothetical protein
MKSCHDKFSRIEIDTLSLNPIFSKSPILTGDRISHPGLAEDGFQSHLPLEVTQDLTNLWSQYQCGQDDNVNDSLQSLQTQISVPECLVLEAGLNWSSR